jgi:hypothetical protein
MSFVLRTSQELSGVIEHPVTQIDDSGDDRCREALPTISRNKVVVKSSQVGEWCRTTNVPVFHEEFVSFCTLALK